MHRIAAIAGEWQPGDERITFVDQQPGEIVIITAADTDILTLSQVAPSLDSSFPSLRVVNLLQLQLQIVIDTYAEEVLAHAKVIILRLIGGQSYWSYGLEVVKATAAQQETKLIVLPGDERPDLNLISHGNVDLGLVNQVWRYFLEAGTDNYLHLLRFVAREFLDRDYAWQPPQPVPRIGTYGQWHGGEKMSVAILFYRAHFLAGNLGVIDALCDQLLKFGIAPLPIFISSLKEPDLQAELLNLCQGVGLILNSTSFAIASLETDSPQVELWQALNLPVLQIIFSGGGKEHWQDSSQGMSPRDMAMNVVLPEVDGRIITRAVSFKAGLKTNAALQTEVVGYEPELSRTQFVAELAANWLKLKHCPKSQRRIALVLANYPNRNGRIANGVGLDTPQSCVEILRALHQEGYRITNLPEDSAGLISALTKGITNDRENSALKPASQVLSLPRYLEWFGSLGLAVQASLRNQWGMPTADLIIPGMQLGNLFIGIQPPRGYDRDPSLNYHAPDLPPTHEYLAFYVWLRQSFGAQAIAHIGKHGNLEWLPGKTIALSADCFPEIALGALPHFYPFIVNDPGEGSQAKRRSQAVILDHLTPPMTRAELHGNMQALEALIDEYYEAQTLDLKRLPAIRDRLQELIIREHLHLDLGISLTELEDKLSQVLTSADGYLCELKEAQIRDGLHIFGQCPTGSQLRDLIIAIARAPHDQYLGLNRAIALDWQLDFDPWLADLGTQLPDHQIIGDWIAKIEQFNLELVESLLQGIFPTAGAYTTKELAWIRDRLLPDLKATDQEITNLLRGLNGEYIPSGASGAPSRSRPEVLPTGRNFYSVDIRAVPTAIAWDVGYRAAELLIETYTQTHGEYPQTVGLSIWGTSTMRTGGDDVAQALALLGVRPKWDNRRVVDFEILPLSFLGRPRVDVTLRISGFFRDAFANLIDLFDSAVEAIASLDEPPDQNPLSARVAQETQTWQDQGLDLVAARTRSRYRIFGSKPSAYGAGLQGLIEAQNWESDADLARAYINWSAYAYSKHEQGKSAPEAFSQRLSQLEIVLQNQDNREHDLLDSDDYYQFQGGMAAAVKLQSGQLPELYFGDHSRPAQPKVRQLSQEISRVYRSRVTNPKWIAGIIRHGYKGAFEMSATLDFLFGFDASTNIVPDFMYAGIAQAYLLDPQVQAFLQQANPWAMRDIAERLLEAHQRQLWQNADPSLIEQLRHLVHAAEGVIEES
ncbi:MAG: cobaltochelatase subunit CobN [Pseudanabaenaceae cyanobacterium bins.68]|nr:cobaltochelatase subunit CobN [Pseudanabaenaceae cyanobacterium bins.68]